METKNRGRGFVDARLKQRLEQYLASHSSQYVDITVVAVELQRLFRMEYGRRNKTAFRIQVEKAYAEIMDKSDLNDLESKHLEKRFKHSHKDASESGSTSDDSVLNDEQSLESAPHRLHEQLSDVPVPERTSRFQLRLVQERSS